MREPKFAPPFLYRSAREERRPRGRLLAPWAEGRGPDEENEEDERPERGTDRSARERNPRLPWLPSHSRLASLPWRRRHLPWSISFSSHRSFRSLAFSATLARQAGSLALAKFRLPRSRGANLLSDGDAGLALSPSLRPSFAEDTERERGKSKKRETDGGDSPRTCTHARYLVLDITAQFRNSLITYQKQVTNATS